MPAASDDEKFASLNTKFEDIKKLKEHIVGETGGIAVLLKNVLDQKKAVSPEGMTKNLKSISSFLENFMRMVQSLSAKIASLTDQMNKIKDSVSQIQSELESR